MLTSGVLVAMTGYDPDVDYAAVDDPEVTITGTPLIIFLMTNELLFVALVEMLSPLIMLMNT